MSNAIAGAHYKITEAMPATRVPARRFALAAVSIGFCTRDWRRLTYRLLLPPGCLEERGIDAEPHRNGVAGYLRRGCGYIRTELALQIILLEEVWDAYSKLVVVPLKLRVV